MEKKAKTYAEQITCIENSEAMALLMCRFAPFLEGKGLQGCGIGFFQQGRKQLQKHTLNTLWESHLTRAATAIHKDIFNSHVFPFSLFSSWLPAGISTNQSKVVFNDTE